MKFYILAVGNKMPDWIKTGYLEYIKRIPPEITVKLIEIKPEKHGNNKQIEQLLSTESQRIQAALSSQCRIVVLDERGSPWTTIEFSKTITRWMNEGGDIAFIIGGSEGLHWDIKQLADEMFALSALTLPHGLVRVLLAEQLYRAISVIKGHPYHRG